MAVLLPLVERTHVARDTMSFALGREGKDFSFVAGQHVTLTLPNPPYQDEKGSTRTFSMASAPGDPHVLFATRMRGSAIKRSLAEVPVGTEVRVARVRGDMILHGDEGRPAVFLAGGIGITPFRSMVRDALDRGLRHRLTLVYSNHTPEDAPFLEELQRWAGEHERFRLVATMTQPERAQSPWSGRTGRITPAMLREVLGDDLGRAIFYAAGPTGMVNGVTGVLGQLDIEDERILSEDFSGY